MVVNDDATILKERGAVEFFASRLAPTRTCKTTTKVPSQAEHNR